MGISFGCFPHFIELATLRMLQLLQLYQKIDVR